jgi:hypothetical protein
MKNNGEMFGRKQETLDLTALSKTEHPEFPFHVYLGMRVPNKNLETDFLLRAKLPGSRERGKWKAVVKGNEEEGNNY